jgi:hypothetical protein
MIKLRITLFFYFLGLIFLPCKAIVTNQYEVHLQYSKTTVVDTSYCRFQSYFAERKKQIIDVEKKYDSTSYRLNKDILTLIDFINRSDTTITLKFYSTLYKYTNVGETDEIIDDKISIKKSALIKSNYMAQYIFTKNIKMFNVIGNSAVDESTKGLMIFFYSIFYQQAFRITKMKKLYFILPWH